MSLNTILATAPLTATGYHLKATGTALGQSLIWDNGTNVGIGNTNTSYTLDVSGTGRFTGALTALSYGNLQNGLDTIQSGFQLSTASGTVYSSNFQLNASGGLSTWTYNATSGWVNRMTITTSGNVGIGTSSPTVIAGVNLIVKALSNAGNGYIQALSSDSGSSVALYSGNDVTDDPTIVYQRNLRFGTSTNSAVTGYSEKMRITSGGYLKATSTGSYNDLNASNFEFVNGTASANSFFVGNTNTSYAAATLVRINGSRTTTNATYNLIGATNGNSTGEFLVRDSGNCQNTNNSYTGTSDIKLKQDIIDANSQWDDIKQMRIRKFRFKKQVEQDENAPYLLGVIAQELELISPNLVDEALDFDGTDKEVNTTTKSVKYSIIYMKAVKALQEAIERIETLESTIQSLQEQINILAK